MIYNEIIKQRFFKMNMNNSPNCFSSLILFLIIFLEMECKINETEFSQKMNLKEITEFLIEAQTFR